MYNNSKSVEIVSKQGRRMNKENHLHISFHRTYGVELKKNPIFSSECNFEVLIVHKLGSVLRTA